MPITPPLFRPPAPGEKLRVIDLVQFHSPISGGVKRFIEDKCRFLETVPDIEHCVVVPGAAHGEDRWADSRVHTIKSPRLIGSASYRVMRDRAASAGCFCSSGAMRASSPNSRNSSSGWRSSAMAAPGTTTAGPASPPMASSDMVRGAAMTPCPTCQP